MQQKTFTLLAALALLAVGVAAYWLFWPTPTAPAPATPPADVSAVVPMPVASAPTAAASAPDAVASAPEPMPEPEVVLPALADADPVVKDSLVALLGKPAVLSFLQTDDFLRRVVATVDNLTRAHATARLWPVNPTAGRFTVGADGHIAAANAARYDPFVKMVEAVDPVRAAAVYRRFYPLLQQSYAELGYPNQRFHGRLLAVLDHLLATPVRSGPLAVTLTEVKGPIVSERPWVRYEYADASLEALSSGQKLMLRTGESNQRRLTSWLQGFRAAIAR